MRREVVHADHTGERNMEMTAAKILVIDDSEDARDLTEAALLSAGYTDLHSAASASAAYECLGITDNPRDPAFAVDIILLDIVMPDIDGIEACGRIRADKRYADVPIIMVSSLDDEESVANAVKAGANGYVAKPVDRAELIARVRAALILKAELDRSEARERQSRLMQGSPRAAQT